jgi:hypothetical protein
MSDLPKRATAIEKDIVRQSIIGSDALDKLLVHCRISPEKATATLAQVKEELIK